MKIRITLESDFQDNSKCYSAAESIKVAHATTWDADIAWDDHLANFLTFLSQSGYFIEYEWVEKLKEYSWDLKMPPEPKKKNTTTRRKK